MRKGFSLIELSIGLVIIGLLTGGILAGQSLLRNAELKSVTSDAEKFITGTHMFREKYDALPGDFATATEVWGAEHATPATCVTDMSEGLPTCNGNDDGVINVSAGSNESFRFWQHLANAGYIEGKYDGITHGATTSSSTVENSPRSKLPNGLWFVWTWGAISASTQFFDGDYTNVMVIGQYAADSWPSVAIMKPEEAWNIDVKIDDGKPAYGNVGPGRLTTCTPAANGSNMTVDYSLSSSATGCTLVWRRPFVRK